MSIAEHPARTARAALVDGDRLGQEEFHRRYRAMRPGTRAELIDGVVSMPSLVGLDHGRSQGHVAAWLVSYVFDTPGVELLDNTTAILDGRSQTQPDFSLRILPECGGRTREQGGFFLGLPELIVEVASSSRYVDLGPKREIYERAAVIEYIVLAHEPHELYWHARRGDSLELAQSEDGGLLRSAAFPGLWLDPLAMLRGDLRRLRDVVRLGQATPEHAAFVARLEAARSANAPSDDRGAR